MNRHPVLRRTLALALTVLMLVSALYGLTNLTERKAGRIKYADFFEEEHDFDVLFLGASHMTNAVYPMMLWKEYGFTSYNLGGHSNAIATSYWVFRMALNETKPKLVVLDCLGISGEAKTSLSSFSYVHVSMDAFPLSRTKVEAVYDLLDDSYVKRLQEEDALVGEIDTWVVEEEDRSPIGLLWDFSVYHNRWSSLGRSDLKPGKNVEKGAETLVAVGVPNAILDVPQEDVMEGDTVSIRYLEKLISECREQGIDILLTYLPFPAPIEAHQEANRVYRLAEQYGLEYINFLDLDLVNYETDCFDTNSHMNRSGAEKVSRYLGSFISSHYDLPDRRSDPEYRSWNEDYERYRQYEDQLLREETDFKKLLMLLADECYDLDVRIHDDRIFGNNTYAALLSNAGISSLDRSDEDFAADLQIEVTDRETGLPIDTVLASYILNSAGEITGVRVVHQ